MATLEETLAHHNTGKTWNKDNLKELLAKQPMVVMFEKVNKEIRKMSCSLVEDDVEPYIDRDVPEEDQKKRPENPNVLSVIDLEKKAWRSFRVDSIIRVMKPDETDD